MIRRDSRCYNRDQFIAKAKAIHGDLYDYSETVLNGSQDPISFKCNRCGTTRMLSQAQCHIRKNKPCGCKPCNHDRLSPCKICGVAVSSKVYHAQAKRCKACCDKAKQDRVAHKESKHGKNCKTCGVWFVDRDRLYCTVECRSAYFESQRIQAACDNCGAALVLRPCETACKRKYCNANCQRAHQASGAWLSQRDLLKKGRSRKKAFDTLRSNRRKQDSQSAKWWAKCNAPIPRLSIELDPWVRKSQTASATLKNRQRFFTKKIGSSKILCWSDAVKSALCRTDKPVYVCNSANVEGQWSKKCDSVSRNMRRRVQIKATKNQRRETLRRGS